MKKKTTATVENAQKLLFVGSEALPFAATGGLGDVMGSLPAALAASGQVDVRVVMPLYGAISAEWRKKMKEEWVGTVRLSWRVQYCGIYSLQKDGVTYYFIDNEYYYNRKALYGHYDDGERYAFFCMAVMELMEKVGFYPDVLHAHDWQAALSVIYLNCLYRSKAGYGNIKTVFTIHNIEYQGQYDFSILGDVFSLGENEHALLEYGGCINLMKAAIECADRVSTVSPRYAEEIRTEEYSHKLCHCLNRNAEKLLGILNGIDYVYYNPAKDKSIAHTFSQRKMEGKALDKLEMQREVGLPERADAPMLSIISRLASHKGLDIIAECIDSIVAENDVQLIVLGMGEKRYEQFFTELEARYPEKVRALITYDRDLSKRIYAATDIFLMPSKSEPCGLSQMIASRYGAIPVVRETGGLFDSIKPVWMDGKELRGNGFTFANYSAEELRERTEAAIRLWSDEPMRKKLVTKIMRTDFSWAASAEKYLEMYRAL
ncbi:MAG: glycogen synthase GlgA [Ruminococcaceae bacterium]|nr:glycogen synthase GlgA [Oscillospiraceae bacterium]